MIDSVVVIFIANSLPCRAFSMRERPSFSRRQRSDTPSELRTDRDEPDWDYSCNATSTDGDWDYSVDVFNPLDGDVISLVPPSQTPNRSHSRRVSSRESRSSSTRSETSHLGRGLGNMCVAPACVTEEPEEQSLFFQTYPDSLERPILRPEPNHRRIDRAVPGAVITRMSANKSDGMSEHGNVISRCNMGVEDLDSTWSSFESGSTELDSFLSGSMESDGFVTEATSLPPPGCSFEFPFLSPTAHKKNNCPKNDNLPKKDDCSQASPTSVEAIVEELSELQQQLDVLRTGNSTSASKGLTSLRMDGSTSASRRSASTREMLAVNKVANFSRKRMDQLDTFIMAKASGRDSPEALRLAYSSSCTPDVLRKALSDSPEARPMDSPDRYKSCSLDALTALAVSNDRDLPDPLLPPPSPPHKPPPKSVRFAKNLVTHTIYRPKTLPQENEKLYFGKEELQQLERDRQGQIYEEQFEIIAQTGTKVAVTFPVRRGDTPPELTDISTSWSTEDGLIEI